MFEYFTKNLRTVSLLSRITVAFLGYSLASLDCCESKPVIPGPKIENPSSFLKAKIEREEVSRIGEEESTTHDEDPKKLFDCEKKVERFNQNICKENNLSSAKKMQMKLLQPTLFLFFHGLGDTNNKPIFQELQNNLMQIGGENVYFEFAKERPDTYQSSIKDQVNFIYPSIKSYLEDNRYTKIYFIGYSMGGLVANDMINEIMYKIDNTSENDKDRKILEKALWNFNEDNTRGASKNKLKLITLASPIKGIDGQANELPNFENAINNLIDKLFINSSVDGMVSKDEIDNIKNSTKSDIKENLIENEAKKKLPGIATDQTQAGLMDLSRTNCNSRKPANVDTLHIKTFCSMLNLVIKSIKSNLKNSDFKVPFHIIESRIRNDCRKEVQSLLNSYSKLLGCDPNVMEHDTIVPIDIQYYTKEEHLEICNSASVGTTNVAIDHENAPSKSHVAYEIIKYAKDLENLENLRNDFSSFSNLFDLTKNMDCYLFSIEATEKNEKKINSDLLKPFIIYNNVTNINDLNDTLSSSSSSDTLRDVVLIINEDYPEPKKSDCERIATQNRIKRIRTFKVYDNSRIERLSDYEFKNI